MDAGCTRELLGRHSVGLKHALGQNFLVDEGVARRIAEASGADRASGVVEIGAGAGALTAQLAAVAGRVVTIEIDRRLEPVLRESLSDAENVEFIFRDAMKVDFAAVVRERIAPLRAVACANLPYQVTTPAVRRLVSSRLFGSVCVMVQLEAARRFAAAPGDAEYNETSAFCAYYSKPELLFEVPANCFEPRPHVTSAVIRFDAKPAPEGGEVEDAEVLRLMRAAFSERRKKFAACLARATGSARERWEELLVGLGFPCDVRGERLGADDFARLARLARESGLI